MTMLSLAALHAAILEAIRGQFPDLATVADYRELSDDHEALPVPALLVELTDLEAVPDDNDGTGRLSMVAVFEATIIMGFRTAAVGRAIREFAGALAVFVNEQRWGVADVEPAQVIRAGLHEFSPAVPRYHAWLVEWRQVVRLGANVWANDGTVPREVVFSWAPEIGPGNEAEYDPVVPLIGERAP